MAYNSAYTGHEIDAAVGSVKQKESAWDAKADKPKAVAVTLTAAGWVDGVQTVTVPGVPSDENQFDVSYIYPTASADAVASAGLYISATAVNSVTFKVVNNAPTTDLLVVVKISEINYTTETTEAPQTTCGGVGIVTTTHDKRYSGGGDP